MQNGLSWQGQYELAQDLVSDEGATNLVMLKTFIHQGQGALEGTLNIGYTTKTRDFTTYTDAISGSSYRAYALPQDFRRMDEVYVTVGSVRYQGRQIHDEGLWQTMNTDTSVTSNYLQFYFIRGSNRIELYPIPSSACTGTFIYQSRSKVLSADDYTTGTITTLANAGTAVTGSGSTWTSAMVGRYFKTDDQMWYKISAVGSATGLTLDAEYQGTSIATGTSTYTIGEFPDTPPETHILPVYYACWKYSLFRRNLEMAREYEKQWKEGVANAQADYANTNSSHIIDSRPPGFSGGINPNFYPTGMS